MWSSIAYYLEGRVLINKAIISEIPDKELIRKAVEKFELAKERYQNANVCHCIYSIVLEFESTETLDDNIVPKLKEKLRIAIDSLPVKIDNSVISVFKEIESIIDSRELKHDPERLRKINRCITKIDYSALRENLSYYILEKLESYSKEPFNPSIFYNNGIIIFKFDEPEKIKGRLTITAGDRILFNESLGKRIEIYNEEYRKNPSQKLEETIVFKTQDGRVTRQLTICDKVKCGNEYLDVHTILHDCKGGICSNFNIAIVQLKYDLYQEDHAFKIHHDDKYLKKVKMILDVLKDEINLNLIVFPEFSIPFEYLEDLKEYSDIHGIFIIAGSHYITDNNLKEHNGLFAHTFGDEDLLKNISPVIIPDSKIMHTEKVGGAKLERESFSNAGMKHGKLNTIFKFHQDVQCGIIICYDLIDDTLRSRIIDACNVIIVPQTNDVPKRLLDLARGALGSPSGPGTKDFVMVNGLFTFPGIDGVVGGDSGVIPTLDKAIYKIKPDSIIMPVYVKDKPLVKEQFIQVASLNMNFNAARDTQGAPVPITHKLIYIFEKTEIVESKKENPETFLGLIETIKSCNDKKKLKEILENNKSLIQNFSPLWHREIWENKDKLQNLNNLEINQIKDKCRSIVVE